MADFVMLLLLNAVQIIRYGLPIIAIVTITRQTVAVLSVARTTTRMRLAVSSLRARAMRSRVRSRTSALGSPSGEKYQFNKDNEMNEKSIKRKRGGRLRPPPSEKR